MAAEAAGDLKGGCLCGALKFHIARDKVLATLLCHCDRCRVFTGAEGGHLLVVPAPAVEFDAGSVDEDMSTFQLREANRAWCKKCGAGLFDFRGEKTFVAMGCLEKPTGLKLKHCVKKDECDDYHVPRSEMEPFPVPPEVAAAAAAAKAKAEAEAAAAKAAEQ